jgi:hypothetical protein
MENDLEKIKKFLVSMTGDADIYYSDAEFPPPEDAKLLALEEFKRKIVETEKLIKKLPLWEEDENDLDVIALEEKHSVWYPEYSPITLISPIIMQMVNYLKMISTSEKESEKAFYKKKIVEDLLKLKMVVN